MGQITGPLVLRAAGATKMIGIRFHSHTAGRRRDMEPMGYLVYTLERGLMRPLTLAIACLPACVAQQAQLSLTGSIPGTVSGSDGTIIAGAYVTMVAVPPYSSGRISQTQWAALSDGNGAFVFAGLNGGTYQVCAQVPQTQWLSPCAWGTSPPAVSLSAGQPTSNVSVVMTKGVVVPIRVNDPQQLLAQNEGITPGAHLLIGIGHPPFLFDTAFVASQDAGGRTYQITIPFGFAATLKIYSSFFQISNAAGVVLPQGAVIAIPFTVAPDQPPPSLVFNVTGGGAQ